MLVLVSKDELQFGDRFFLFIKPHSKISRT